MRGMSLAVIVTFAVAGCNSAGTEVDSAADPGRDTDADPGLDEVGDVDGIDPDVSSDHGDVPADAYADDIEWAECPAPESIPSVISGPSPGPGSEITIDAEGVVTAVEVVDDGLDVEIDFTSSNPGLGVQTFKVAAWVSGIWDLTVGDTVRVAYHLRYWFWPMRCISIIRDGTVLLSASDNDSCPATDEMTVTSMESGCEPLVDDCAAWLRYYVVFDCPGLPEPARVLDGSEGDVGCGPGYHVAVGAVREYGHEISTCTDMPGGVTSMAVVRMAE